MVGRSTRPASGVRPLGITIAAGVASVLLLVRLEGPILARQSAGYQDSLLAAVKASDPKKVQQLVTQNRNDAEICFWNFADKYVSGELAGGNSSSVEALEVLKALGNAFYTTKDDSDWNKYAEFLVGLDSDKKDTWNRARDAHVAFAQARNQALLSRKPEDCDSAIPKGEDAFRVFEPIADNFVLAWCKNGIGELYQTKGEWAKALDIYKEALTYAQSFGSKNYERMIKLHMAECERRKSESKGAEEKDKEKGEGKGETALESGWTAVKFVYRLDGEKPISTPSPLSTEEYTLWSRVVVTKSAPADFADGLAGNPETFAGYYQQSTAKQLRKDSPLAKQQFLLEKGSLYLDRNDNGKGEGEEKLKVTTKPGVEEFDLPVAGEGKNSKTFKYAMNMVRLGQEKSFNLDATYGSKDEAVIDFQRACHMEGEFQGKKIQLLDDTNNGTYDDYGADSMTIGNGAPQFLSRIITLDDKFYVLKPVDPIGTEIRFKPWEGETGSVALKWKGTLPPKYLYIRGLEGEGLNGYFNLDPKTPIKVPVGNYTFYFGLIREGQGRRADTIEIRQGKSKPFVVKANEAFTLELGAPFEYDFRTTKDKDKVLLRGRDLRIYGKAGEIYTRMYPEFPLPEVSVKKEKGGIADSQKMRLIERAEFNKDSSLVWYPKDFEFDPKGVKGKWLFKLTTEFKLLGKITCDFKEGTGG